MIASGAITIKKGKDKLADLQCPQYFAEIGLLDDAPRIGDVIAVADGVPSRSG